MHWDDSVFRGDTSNKLNPMHKLMTFKIEWTSTWGHLVRTLHLSSGYSSQVDGGSTCETQVGITFFRGALGLRKAPMPGQLRQTGGRTLKVKCKNLGGNYYSKAINSSLLLSKLKRDLYSPWIIIPFTNAIQIQWNSFSLISKCMRKRITHETLTGYFICSDPRPFMCI